MSSPPNITSSNNPALVSPTSQTTIGVSRPDRAPSPTSHNIPAVVSAASLDESGSHNDTSSLGTVTSTSNASPATSGLITPTTTSPPPTSRFDIDIESQSQSPAPRTLTLTTRIFHHIATFHEDHAFAVRTTGVIFALSVFSLELWGRIDDLVQDA